MTPKNQIKRATPLPSLIAFVLACFAFLPRIQAITPSPDGCYPGFTTAEGCNALNSLNTGAGNTAIGWYSLFSDISGSYNTGLGAGTLALNNGVSNTAVGTGAMLLNTTGGQNVAVGSNALLYNDSGSNNNAVGAFALRNNDSGSSNNAFGLAALDVNTTGSQNQAMGHDALGMNDSGFGNVAIGERALSSNVNGSFNTAVGWRAGSNVEGNENIYIGDQAGVGSTAESGTIRIGEDTLVTSCYIAGILDNPQPYGAGFDSVAINLATGQLARYHDSAPSSRRYKEDIKPIDDASEAIFSLKPVTFRYKKEIDPTGVSQFGLVAEDVEKVNPALVKRGEDGKVFTVRYESVNAMLLNEFLKEHKKVEEQNRKLERQARRIQEQEAAVTQLKKEMETVVAGLKKQASEIRRVIDQVEMEKTAPELAASDQ